MSGLRRRRLSDGRVDAAAGDVLLCRDCAPGGRARGLSAEAMLFLKSATSDRAGSSGNAGAGAARRARARNGAPPAINVHLDKDLKSARVLREMRQAAG